MRPQPHAFAKAPTTPLPPSPRRLPLPSFSTPLPTPHLSICPLSSCCSHSLSYTHTHTHTHTRGLLHPTPLPPLSNSTSLFFAFFLSLFTCQHPCSSLPFSSGAWLKRHCVCVCVCVCVLKVSIHPRPNMQTTILKKGFKD